MHAKHQGCRWGIRSIPASGFDPDVGRFLYGTKRWNQPDTRGEKTKDKDQSNHSGTQRCQVKRIFSAVDVSCRQISFTSQSRLLMCLCPSCRHRYDRPGVEKESRASRASRAGFPWQPWRFQCSEGETEVAGVFIPARHMFRLLNPTQKESKVTNTLTTIHWVAMIKYNCRTNFFHEISVFMSYRLRRLLVDCGIA